MISLGTRLDSVKVKRKSTSISRFFFSAQPSAKPPLFAPSIGHRCHRSPALEPPPQTTAVYLFTTIPQNAIRLICLSIARGQGGQGGQAWLLSLRLVGRAWRHAVPAVVMEAFPHARLVVPRGVLHYCTPEFVARTLRAFKNPAHRHHETVLGLRIGRGTERGTGPGLSGRKASSPYPGPMALSSIASAHEIDGVAVTLCLSRSPQKRAPLAHLASSLSALLASGKLVSLRLGTENDRCSYDELLEIVRVVRGAPPCVPPVESQVASANSGDTQTQTQIELQRAHLRVHALELQRAHEIDAAALDPTLAACRARVRGLEITQNPVLLRQKRGASLFATLISTLPSIERLVIDHSCNSANTYKLLAPTIARMSRLSSLTLDGCPLDPGRLAPFPFAVIQLPPTLVTLSLRRISVGTAYLSQLLAGISALESITSCDLSGALGGMPDLACVSGIVSLVNQKTVRCIDLSCNTLFTNRYTPDRQLIRSLLASETLHSLTLSSVRTPPHVVEALITALPTTRLVHLEISRGVHSTVISDLAVELLRAAAPASCTLEVGPHATSWH